MADFLRRQLIHLIKFLFKIFLRFWVCYRTLKANPTQVPKLFWRVSFRVSVGAWDRSWNRERHTTKSWVLASLATLNAAAPIASVPQNICSTGQFLLAGRFGKNSMSLEGKCSWEIDNAGCLRGFDVWNRLLCAIWQKHLSPPNLLSSSPPPPSSPTEGLNFALWSHLN